MKAVAYGADGFAGDSGFSPDDNVEAPDGASFEELVEAWARRVAVDDHDGTLNPDGSVSFEDGTMSGEELIGHVEEERGDRPVGFWILEDEDLERILAGSAVECWNDSSVYAVNQVAKRMCAQFAKRTVGTLPGDD